MTTARSAMPFGFAVLLWLVLAAPVSRHALEGAMILHMAVQLPLLALVGVFLAAALRSREPDWLARADWLGLCGVTLALFAMAYWMVPRSLDSALADPRIELAKFLSTPLALGLPLGLSWPRVPPLGRAFLIANFISMVGTLGALYLTAPLRLCLSYALDQQKLTGEALIAAAVALTAFFLLAALLGQLRVDTRGNDDGAAGEERAAEIGDFPRSFAGHIGRNPRGTAPGL
ncbi:MAG TPA: hypothetical protein VJR47_03200 [Stellaceae bacterium]|nr:hypothetical protein [Stellaceae bacterium]